MTTEPSPDPRDVIARAMHDAACPVRDGKCNLDPWRPQADAALAAIDTDPAVADALITGHTDAILAALTRAGVLHEEHDTQQAWNRRPAFHDVRLVTPWREAT